VCAERCGGFSECRPPPDDLLSRLVQSFGPQLYLPGPLVPPGPEPTYGWGSERSDDADGKERWTHSGRTANRAKDTAAWDLSGAPGPYVEETGQEQPPFSLGGRQRGGGLKLPGGLDGPAKPSKVVGQCGVPEMGALHADDGL